MNQDQLLDDLKSYIRHLCLREFFADKNVAENDNQNENENQSEAESKAQEVFRPPSKWIPPKGRDATLESYVRGVTGPVEEKTLIGKSH